MLIRLGMLLKSMQQPTIWIVGGVDKGKRLFFLKDLLNKKVLGIVCLGKDNNKIKEAFGSIVESFFEASSAEQAVQISYRIAKKGYNVLLSPACASFDLFKNYEDRGHQFKSAVRSFKFYYENSTKKLLLKNKLQIKKSSL